MRREHFDVGGMTCSACASRVGRAVEALDGVKDVAVNLLKNSMTVAFDEASVTVEKIAAAVERAGYGASLKGGGKGQVAATRELEAMKRRLAVSFLFAVPLFYLAMGGMSGLPLPALLSGAENAAGAFTQFLLVIPVLFVNGSYFRTGLKTLFSGAPNMDSLVAIGSGAAALFGVCAIYGMILALERGDAATARHFAANLYFDSAATILTLISLGKFFEARARGKTSEAIARLMNLAPKSAIVLRDGIQEAIPLEKVQAGDTLVVKAGESVPVDGVITEGSGFLDESVITGESLPLEKLAGEQVTGASINKAGHFLMRATRVGEDTALAQIIRLVDEATSSKAPIARLADKISGIFVPFVIATAIVAAAVWLLLGHGVEFALSTGIAVLVISCPCALGLATPTAIMVGTGRGAANGILIKSAEAVETAQSVDTVVLDKTGTLTEGRPAVTDIVAPFPGNEEEVLACAASLEILSEHPLGTAVVREAERRGLPLRRVTGFTQLPGQGLAGTADGSRYIVGNARMLQTEKIPASVDMLTQGETLAAEGKTALYVARNEKLLGIMAVADVLRPTSRRAVAELRDMGIDVVMLTGDNARTAAAAQRLAGIDRVLAEVLPQDKEREIRALQKQGKKVAMVGDGINDAPALTRADVGIAIGAGTDIAMESADIVLMKSDPLDVVTAIRLSRAVMCTIRQNLFWAFFYNCVGIPVAAGAFYGLWGLTLNPMIAAAAMSLSSVSVVGNALRLRFFRPTREEIANKPASPARTGSIAMTRTVHINGMNCGHCAASITKALQAVSGVTDVSVDMASKTAMVETEADVTEDALKTAVIGAGFEFAGLR